MSEAYFPPLDRCLAGEERLLSWKTAYRLLGDYQEALESSALEAFMKDGDTFTLLVDSVKPFASPSPKTKAEFETKTAPINVSQSSCGGHSLEELKKDAQWLSNEMRVAELSALRVVVLESQTRAEDELRTAAAKSNDTVDLDSQRPLANNIVSASKPPTNGSEDNARRSRQIAIYLEEKSYLLRTGTWLMERCALQPYAAEQTHWSWLDQLARQVYEANLNPTHETQDHISMSLVKAVTRLLEGMRETKDWPERIRSEDQLQPLYLAAITGDIASVLRMLLANLAMLQTIPGPDLVTAWYKLMERVGFFQDLGSVAAMPDAAGTQCLVSTISLTILRLPEIMDRLQEWAISVLEGAPQPQPSDEAYIRNEACVKDVNLAMYRAVEENVVVAAPAIYAWSMITRMIRDIARLQQESRDQLRLDDISDDSEARTRRRASRRDSKDDFSISERLYYILQDFEFHIEARDDPPAFMARLVVDQMGIYNVIPQLSSGMTRIYGSDSDLAPSFLGRSSLLDLVREGMQMVAYGAETVEALLAILSPDAPGRSKQLDAQIANRVAGDTAVFRSAVLDEAILRYPYELVPMLRLLTALSPISHEPGSTLEVVQLLEGLQTMTLMVQDSFRAYKLDHEDENTNSMALIESLPLFVWKSVLPAYGTGIAGGSALIRGNARIAQSSILEVGAGAEGTVVKESRPLVFQLKHPHSGFEYLGLLLSTLQGSSELVAAHPTGQLDRGTAAEIVTFVNSILEACTKRDNSEEDALWVLGRLAYPLPDEQDFVTIITDILEMELLAHLDQSAEEGSLELLIACTEFLKTLAVLTPDRAWSILARSSLLAIEGGAAALTAVVAGIEVTIGRFRFLAACVSMYSHLITNAITGLARRKASPSKTSNRFDSPTSFQDSTPERTMSTVLNAFTTVMVEEWQSLGERRFVESIEKIEITTLILTTFDKLLQSAYGIDSGSEGIVALLDQPALALLEACVSGADNGASLQPLTAALAASIATSDGSLISQQQNSLKRQGLAAMRFLMTLIRTAKLEDHSGDSASLIGNELLTSMPVFASLFAMEHSFKAPLAELLTEVVRAVQTIEGETPSLLGNMGPASAKAFLTVISHLDLPLRDLEVEKTIWTLLSAVMRSKQQWFALYLLTGAIPKDRLKNAISKDATPKTKSLLVFALEQLEGLATLPPERATAMLKFVASAQNTWAWAANEVRSHPEFLKNCLEWLNNLQIPHRAPNIAEETLLANEHEMAAFLCDILAVNIHSSNEIGDRTLVKMLPMKLTFLRQHGVSVNAYKRSLHQNLAENFARKFAPCELAEFARTAADPAPFGRNHYYNLGLANQILGHEVAWHGAKHSGFSDELARANVNLSLVEAQTRLLKSWRVLATALCDCIDQEPSLQAELAQTAENCLRANASANLEQPGMDKIVKIRAEMAFVIVSRLVREKTADAAMRRLLFAAWDLVRSSPTDYDVATASEDLTYYRTILQILYLAIQPYIYMATVGGSPQRSPQATDETKPVILDPAVATCFVQIMTRVVAPGFRALCGNLHNDVSLAEPRDFALITALVQATVSVPGITAVYHQLAEAVSSTSIVRGALSLYSWSDRLAEQLGQDPVYGEVAVTFLLSLSTIRPVAEHMGLEGVLLQLSSANLSSYFRKAGGKGPFSEPKRMFVIWTEGFLPLCLNLLSAIGPPIAAQVSAFLNSFPQQLQRSNTSLENREATRQNPFAGAITLGLVSEAHSLCLISLILTSDIARGAAGGIDAADVPALEYDYGKTKDDAAGLMRQKTSLASRVVPVGDREEAWAAAGAGTQGDNVLLTKVVQEINGISACFDKQ